MLGAVFGVVTCEEAPGRTGFHRSRVTNVSPVGYLEAMGDDNEFGLAIRNEELMPEHLPEPDAPFWGSVDAFALTFDGYEHFGSFEACAQIANAARRVFDETGRTPRFLDELRGCLFFEQRRWRHFDDHPNEDAFLYIGALLDGIRRVVIDRTLTPEGPYRLTRRRLVRWASEHGVPLLANDYTASLNDNLFVPLSADSVKEFSAGRGSELGDGVLPGKMQALHSSSALAANVFEYWRGRDASPLARALHVPSGISRISFEHQLKTGTRGSKANLDVMLGMSDGSWTAIESKFLEPYAAQHGTPFKAAYFGPRRHRWREHGFGECQSLAEALHAGTKTYRWLYTEQLLKHALALAIAGGQWRLIYLWYKPQGSAGEEHEREAGEFARIARADGIDFRSVTYQRLLDQLEVLCDEGLDDYSKYLRGRYFA